jgi:hypothetical protein
MHDHYPIEFDEIAEEYFTKSGLRLIGVGEADVFAKVDAIAKYDLLSAVSTAYSLLEAKVYEILGHDESSRPVMIWHDRRFYSLLKAIDKSQIDNEPPKSYFDSIRQMRNISVHRQHHKPEEHQEDMAVGLAKIKKLYQAIGKLPEEEIQKVINNG